MTDKNDPLQSLYPFLESQPEQDKEKNRTLLDSIHAKAAHSLDVKQAFFEKNAQALVDTACSIAAVYRNNGRIFTMGNGGSSCDAAHFAVEFQHPVTTGRPALPATNLCCDTAFISAVSNDVGVAHVFARQINAHARKGDGLVGFSTSGNSENMIAAYKKARQTGLLTIAFTGGNGGILQQEGLVDHCLVVETDSIHRIQEVHVTCYHILWDIVHTLLADQRGLLGQAIYHGEETN